VPDPLANPRATAQAGDEQIRELGDCQAQFNGRLELCEHATDERILGDFALRTMPPEMTNAPNLLRKTARRYTV
jgi:hypothetical protein